MSKEDGEEGRDSDAKPKSEAKGRRPVELPGGRRALRAVHGEERSKARRRRRGGSQLVPATSGTAAALANRRALPVSRRVEAGDIAPLSGPKALQFSPAAWSTEALRIDHAAANRKRRRGFFLRMFAFVALPTLLAAAYVYFYATPRYVSEFQVTYQTTNPQSNSGSSSLLGSLLGASTGGPAVDMTRVIWSYLLSDTLLQKIDKELNLRGHYSNPRIDWWDRLPANASREAFLNYFNKRVSIDDMMGGYVVVDVEAFTPKFAQAIAKAMAAACDEMVENLTARSREEQVRVAEAQLKKTQKRLVKATLAVTNFRNEHVDFNPSTMAGQLDSVVGGLESQLAQTRATLTSDQTFLSQSAPQVVTLKSQIAGLEKQIDAEKLRLASTGTGSTARPTSDNAASVDSTPYSKLVAEWTDLELELKFATDSYMSAKSAYDLSQVEQEQQQNFVETFVKPDLPQHSTSPDPWTWLPATFFISLAAYAILSVLVGSFRDQAGL